jgi:hypothetical protein
MYQCSQCNKQFLHTAKLTEYSTPQDIALDEDTTAKGVMNTLDASVCPFCKSKAYTETVEEKQVGGIKLEDIGSLIDCAPSEANNYLDQGYVLYQTWQKNVFLVKLKQKAPVDAEPDELGKIIQAGIEQAKKEAQP